MAQPSNRSTWPFALAGALIGLAIIVAIYAGRGEGINPIFYLGAVAAPVGGLLGATVGGILNDRRSRRAARAAGPQRGQPSERKPPPPALNVAS